MPGNCKIKRRRERFDAPRWNKPLRAWRKLRRVWAPTRFSGHTLFHSTYFTRPLESGLPEVATVYDMIPERFESRDRQWGQDHIDNKLQCMEAAQRVMCISNATAADVAEIYPHLKPKLCAIHLGADHFENGDFHEPTVDDPYLLQIGDRHGYKNFDIVLRAMEEKAWPARLKVLVAGPTPTSEEIALVRSRSLESRVTFKGRVSDQVLQMLFRKATGFVFPSLYEGFGFPLLEAQSQGTPVLCSDIPVFRETAGDTAVFFNPQDPASVAAAACKLMDGDAASARLQGLKNVARFRWDECARLTTLVYQAVSKA